MEKFTIISPYFFILSEIL